MDNQKKIWDNLHQEGVMEELRQQPSEYVQSIMSKIPNSARILELGCGTGGDAYFLQEHGYEVTATDFSEVVISANTAALPKVHFQIMDISERFSVNDDYFNVVYANLSLHYFDDKVTNKIFSEIYRVLKPKGLLAFRCKSIYSRSEKQEAIKVARDTYIKDGHIRHLFSTDYIKDLFDSNKFKTVENKYTQGMVYKQEAYFVEAIGEKL